MSSITLPIADHTNAGLMGPTDKINLDALVPSIGVVNATSVAVGVINAASIGTLVTNTYITIGNSSVNSTVNSTSFAFNSTGVTIKRPSSTTLIVNNALSNVATAQAVFPTGQQTVTLAATTTYLIDGLYMVSNATNSVATSIQTAFGNSAAISTIYYTAMSSFSNNNGGTVNALSTSVFASSNALTAVLPSVNAAQGSALISIKGTIVTGAASVNITPQIGWSIAPTIAPNVLTGSYITFTPVTNSASNTVGTWA